MVVAHDTLTELGLRNTTVMFSGAPVPGIDPGKRQKMLRAPSHKIALYTYTYFTDLLKEEPICYQ
jgi:hypothetical protein